MSEMKIYRLPALPFGRGTGSGADSPGSRRRRQSEGDARAETPLAGLVRPRGSRDKAEVAVVDVAGRMGEVRVVSRVQCLCAEMKLNFLRERERAEDAHVGLEEPRTTKIISAHASEARACLLCPGTI